MAHEQKHAAVLLAEQAEASGSLTEAGRESATQPQSTQTATTQTSASSATANSAMSGPATPGPDDSRDTRSRRRKGFKAQIRAALPFTSADARWEDYGQHDAELFYLQKQIQQQTPMIVVLEDGRQLQGIIEWYDRNSIKLRGRQRVLVYKSAIKYIYKQGENSGNIMQ